MAAARDGRSMLIAVAGCVAQAEGKEIIRRAGAVDLVVGSQNYHRLPEMIARAQAGEKIIDTEFPVEDKFDLLAAPGTRCHRQTRHRGFRHRAGRLRQVLHILRGALYAWRRNFAAGGEDRQPRSHGLADAGVREVTLIGQNVNAYHGVGRRWRPITLGQLLRRLARGARHPAAALHHQPSARHG